MEIMTMGRGQAMIIPDEVQITIYFEERDERYDEALTKGTESINTFAEQVLLPLGFNKEDLKTLNLAVREERKYVEETQNYQVINYVFQSEASLKFPYDKDLLALYLKQISNLANPLHFNINFGLKNEEIYRKKIIENAYHDALEKASIIANTVNKKIKNVIKASYEPIDASFLSRTSLNNEQMIFNNKSNIDTYINYLTPLDILVEVSLNYLFIAE